MILNRAVLHERALKNCVQVELHAACGSYYNNLFQKLVISRTHKRTEGRATVWGSEFTTKVAHYRGGIQEKPLLG